jgi:Reverse transcriptase (RNA-dependent DNA polymerase)
MKDRTDDNRSNPRRLWHTYDSLLGRCDSSVVTEVAATDLHFGFDAMVATVRKRGGYPDFSATLAGCIVCDLRILSVSDVTSVISSLPCKQCLLDPWPTRLNALLPDLWLAYVVHCSIETAILHVVSDILSTLESGNLVLLMLRDLSAAFDSVDHDTVVTRLLQSYGLTGSTLIWFQSYLSGRTQFVRVSAWQSVPLPVAFGVPQGTILGPIFFLLYFANLQCLVRLICFYLMLMLMTFWFTAPVDRLMFRPLLTAFFGVLTTSLPGWRSTEYSWTRQDLSSQVLLQQKAAPNSCGSKSHRGRFHSACCLSSWSGRPAGLGCLHGFACSPCVQLVLRAVQTARSTTRHRANVYRAVPLMQIYGN